MMGELRVVDEQGSRPATTAERLQLQEKEQWDREEQAAIEESFAKFQAARAQAEDREALRMAMNESRPLPPKRMRLEYEIKTGEGVSVARGSHDVLVEATRRSSVSPLPCFL